MHVPNAFKDLCRLFHQDMMVVNPSAEAAILEAIAPLHKDQRQVVLRFLEELLSSSHDNGDLRNVWRQTSAQIRFSNSRDLRVWLRLIHRLLEQQTEAGNC